MNCTSVPQVDLYALHLLLFTCLLGSGLKENEKEEKKRGGGKGKKDKFQMSFPTVFFLPTSKRPSLFTHVLVLCLSNKKVFLLKGQVNRIFKISRSVNEISVIVQVSFISALSIVMAVPAHSQVLGTCSRLWTLRSF